VVGLRLGSGRDRWHDAGVDEHTIADEVDQADVPVPRRRRVDRPLLIVSFVIAVGLVFVARGLLVGVTGDERANLPATVESVTPVPDAEQALAQTNVVVDLAPGHTGVLVIDGIEIPTVDLSSVQTALVEPGQQVSIPPVTVYEPGNHTLTYTPSANGPIDRFTSGVHRVQVIHWLVTEGRERARTFTWQFNVV
jgi:hypothetical protein